jgi:hypothetical protein
VGFTVQATGGVPLTYRWRRDGVPLSDGALASGAIVSGATTPTLRLTGITVADAGSFDVVATTPCGDTVSSAARFTIKPAPAMPGGWTPHNMHPSWANWSRLSCVRGTTIAGSAWMPFASWSMIEQPTVWTGTDPESATNLAPAGSAGGAILAQQDGGFVGWWWWPYSCWASGQWYTCYNQEAAAWAVGTQAHTSLAVPGWEFSVATCVDGALKAGYVFTDDAGPDTYTFNAGLWTAGNAWVPLQPPGQWRSIVEGADAGRQFGWSFADGSFTAHAAGWSGSAASMVDMNPPGEMRSLIYGAGGGQQVGIVGFVHAEHAGLWAGNAAAFRDLHPAGATESAAYACAGGYQVGEIILPSGIGHAAIWAGSPESVVDLHALLGTEFNASIANGIDVAPDGTVTVVGSAYHPSAGRDEAMLWVSRPILAGDVNGDGRVDGADLGILLGAWGTGGTAADLNHDGAVDGADLGLLLGAWTG